MHCAIICGAMMNKMRFCNFTKTRTKNKITKTKRFNVYFYNRTSYIFQQNRIRKTTFYVATDC